MSVLNHMNQNIVSGISSLIFLRNRFNFFLCFNFCCLCRLCSFQTFKINIFFPKKTVVFIAFPLRRHMLAKHKSAASLGNGLCSLEVFKNILKLANLEIFCVCSSSVYSLEHSLLSFLVLSQILMCDELL